MITEFFRSDDYYAVCFVLQTLYTFPDNFRAYKALIVAQYSGAKIKVASEPPEFTFGETNKTDEFLKKFPLGRVRFLYARLLVLEL